MAEPLLDVRGISVAYGQIQAVWDLSLELRAGEVVVLLGANGSGKTTTLRAISGLLRPRAGAILFKGQRIDVLPPYELANLGIAHVPEGRKVFPHLTVLENLQIGAYGRRGRARIAESLERVYDIFPTLRERARQLAGTLSGGQQQMAVIGRGLMSCPELLMLDEPSQGLMPRYVESLFEAVRRVNRSGVSVLLVEQNVRCAAAIGTRCYVLRRGRKVLEGDAGTMESEETLRRAYLGV